MKLMSLVAAVALGTIAVATTAAAAPAWEFTTPGNDFSNGTWDFAYAFTVNTAVTASGLGYYASPTNGFVDANPVGLYQCSDVTCSGTGTLLASAIVDNTYALLGHFRYVTITPVALTPGVGYEVAGISNGDNYTWNDAGFAADPAINFTLHRDRWTRTGTLTFLPGVKGDQADGYWGPNVFLGSAGGFTGGVPEPTSWALLVGGFGLVGATLRRSRAVVTA